MKSLYGNRVYSGAFSARLILAGLVCLLAVVPGCALFDRTPPVELPKDVPAAWSSEVSVEELPVASSMLDLIDDDSLRLLVQEALDNNPNLQATALRLKASGYMLSSTRSRLLPKASAEMTANRNNQDMNLLTGKPKITDTIRPSLGISWELDIWGRLADEHAASRHQVLSQEYEYLYARDAMAARIIQLWIQQVAIRKALDIEQERLSVLEKIETFLVDRYRDGIGSLDELATARSRSQIAKADSSTQNAALSQNIRQLEVLLGRYPEGGLLSTNELPHVAPPPSQVPAKVLLHRPDVQGALSRVEAANRLSNSAKKALLPELRLSGQVFRESAHLSDLGGATSYWNILGGLFQPLFEGGRIIDESRARKTEAEAALLDLHQVVLQALKEVEDTMDLERELEAQARALEMAVKESEKSSKYYAERYRQGLDTIQSLLIAKEQEMMVRIRLNEVLAERLKNRVDLALALGVGMAETSQPAEGA